MNSAADIVRITREYTPLVKAAAAKYQGRGAEYEDLVQEGYMALVVLRRRRSPSRSDRGNGRRRRRKIRRSRASRNAAPHAHARL